MAFDTEAAQLAEIARLAQLHGVLWHHCVDGRRCAGDPGFPDVVLVGLGGVLYRELKTSPGLRPAQTAWKLQLAVAGVDYRVWYPSDFRIGNVEREIAAIASHTPASA